MDGDELYARGVALVNQGRYAQAHRALSAAATAGQQSGNADLHARVIGTTAYLRARQGDAEAAARMCAEALEVPGLSATTSAILQGQLGSIEMERGRPEAAVGWLDRAITGLSADPVRAANLRMNRSLVHMQRGRLSAAAADLEQAEADYRAAGMEVEAQQSVHNRGYVAMLAGDLVDALEKMESARTELDERSDMWAAISALDRAEVLRDAGLTTEAEQALTAVAVVFGRLRLPLEQARAELHLAQSLLHHSPVRAAEAARAARQHFRARGGDGWASRAEAVRLRARLASGALDRRGEVVGSRVRPPSAREVSAVAAELDGHGFHSDADALRLAEQLARARAGRRAEGTVRLRRGAPLDVVLLAQEVRTERARLDGRESQVRAHAAKGMELLDAARGTTGSLDLQSSTAMRGVGLAAAGLASAMRSGRAELIFEWSERTRNATQRTVPLRPAADPELAADLARLRLLRLDDPEGDWLTTPEATRLRERARARQWARGVPSQPAAPAADVTLSQARQALDGQTGLLTYVYDGRRLVVLAVTAARVDVVEVDWPIVRAALRGLRADLDISAAVRTGPLAAAVAATLTARLAELDSLLVRPALAVLPDPSRLVVTAPGVLAGLPWSMLPSLQGRVLTLASSVTAWTRTRAREARPITRVGLIAGPRVARAEEEVRTAAVPWPQSSVLVGAAATVDAVTALAAEVEVLHVAAHGRHAADHPLFSGLELSDGTLFGHDVDRVSTAPDTVILSACELGRSAVRWGEEAVGMARAWLHAGARSVIAAPVVVADDAACELLAAMHTALARGSAPAEALAEAGRRTGLVTPFQAHGTGF